MRVICSNSRAIILLYLIAHLTWVCASILPRSQNGTEQNLTKTDKDTIRLLDTVIQNDSKTDSHVAYTLVNSNNSWSIDDSNADQKQEEKDGSDDIAPRVRGTSLFLYVTAILLLSILVLLCLIDNSVYALIRHFLARQRRLEKERAAKATITTTAASTASSPTEAEDSYQRG